MISSPHSMRVIGAELPMGVPPGAVLRCGDACLRTKEVAALAMVLAPRIDFIKPAHEAAK